MPDKLSEDCRCEHWPACNRCLREELKKKDDDNVILCSDIDCPDKPCDDCDHLVYYCMEKLKKNANIKPSTDGKELDRLLSLRGKVFKTKEEYEEWLNDETPKDILVLSKKESFILAGLIKELVLVHGHDKTQDEKEVIDRIFKCAYPEKPKE